MPLLVKPPPLPFQRALTQDTQGRTPTSHPPMLREMNTWEEHALKVIPIYWLFADIMFAY